jgi:hypothetical protein
MVFMRDFRDKKSIVLFEKINLTQIYFKIYSVQMIMIGAAVMNFWNL